MPLQQGSAEQYEADLLELEEELTPQVGRTFAQALVKRHREGLIEHLDRGCSTRVFAEWLLGEVKLPGATN